MAAEIAGHDAHRPAGLRAGLGRCAACLCRRRGLGRLREVGRLTLPVIGRAVRDPVWLGQALMALSIAWASRRAPSAAGTDGVWERICGLLCAAGREPVPHAEWIEQNERLTPADRSAIAGRIVALGKRPTFSIVMPAPAPAQAADTIVSLGRQLYGDWELCLACPRDAAPDDGGSRIGREIGPRLRVVSTGDAAPAGLLERAIAAASGDYIALVRPGDTLSEHALYMLAEAVAAAPGAALLYSDEDSIDRTGRRSDPQFKPDWNPELLCSRNYVGNGLVAFRREVAHGALAMGPLCSPCPAFDLLLRVTEQAPPDTIRHVPHILYHAAATAGPGGRGPLPENAAAAVAAHFARQGLRVAAGPAREGTLRLRVPLPRPRPPVSIIIPTRDRAALLRRCIDALVRRTAYRPIEIVVVDNGSRERDAVEFLADLAASGSGVPTKVLHRPGPFNYSALNNEAARHCSGELLCLLNNDVEALHPDWLDEMVSHALRPGIGAVGAKLYYPDDTVQHAGVTLGHGLGGIARHAHRFLPRGQAGYMGRAAALQQVSAVTAACMVLRRAIYEEAGGLDERNLPVTFSDVDLCLRLGERGYRIVWTPHAELRHHEAASRGSDFHLRNVGRFRREVRYMSRRWEFALLRDPHFNPNLSRHGDFVAARRSRADRPWRTQADGPAARGADAPGPARSHATGAAR